MKHRITAILAAALALISCGRAAKTTDYYVCAYIWPSCHDDSLARELIWPAGEGEWEIINRADARFPGHYQPREPLWKGDRDDDPAVVEKHRSRIRGEHLCL